MIDFIDNKANEKDNILSYVKSPQDLLYSLRELDNHIGNEGIKKKIVGQTIFLIKKKKRVDDGENINTKDMLNICLYGGPGMGKTTIAKIMGKIILSVGLVRGKKVKGASDLKRRIQDPNRAGMLYFIFILALLIIPLLTSMFLIAALIIGFAIISLYIIYSETDHEKESTLMEDPEGSIILASKADMVEGYLGQSQKKTRNLFHRAIGGVLIIDEAYEIVSDDRDFFGKESLTELNLLMSERAGEVVIIFCGYKDEIKQNIFKRQKGLKRRFQWHFECEPYNSHELFQIFELQLKKQGYKIFTDDIEMIMEEFTEHKFKAQGGDTEKLVLSIIMNMETDLDTPTDRQVRYGDVTQAIKEKKL